MNPVWRLARRLGFGRNSLRRPLDRVDGVVVGLAVLLGAAIVVAGVVFGLQLGGYEAGVAAQQQATRTTTTAVLLGDSDASQTALARWTTADGAVHTGSIDVVAEQRAGTTVQIWTDPTGAVVSRPIGLLEVVLLVVVTLAAGYSVAFILLRGLVFLARLPIERWSARAWDRDWARTAPRWKQRRHG
ncbi:Rv1733c family protein [Kutzneria sp. CA-103260]|uniref:Rv1733c family protein n=1 Tax=Kutzneria sp. CA-103260 TaxID=2802641 RepID=UPI001BA5320B|nr:hypothetical protein [Kutzneria sp. CA-103260]QUQ64047.1 transmembrane protein [Kutzneria sp. CA-103260]